MSSSCCCGFLKPKILQKRHDDDENQQISSKRILDKDPDLPLQIGDAYRPPNTLRDGGGGVATTLCMAVATRTAAGMPWGGNQRGGDVPPAVNGRGDEQQRRR